MLLLGLAARPATAQLIEPNEYVTAPGGTNIALGYYMPSWNVDYNVKNEGTFRDRTHLTVDLGVGRYVHYFDLDGTTAVLQVYQPFGYEHEAKIAGQNLPSAFGAANTILGATIWPISDPAAKTYLGLSEFANIPDGSYDSRSPFNLGDNRFSDVLQVGLNKGFGTRVSVDAVGDVTFYAPNTQPALAPSGVSLNQTPSYRVQLFANYNLNPAAVLSLGFEGQYGGVIEVGGTRNGQKTEFDRLRAVGSTFLTPTWQVLAEVSHDLNAVGGFRQELGLTFRVLKVF